MTLALQLGHRGTVLASHAGRLLLILVLALVLRTLLHRAVRRLVRTVVEGSTPVVLRPLKERARGTMFEATALLSERRRQRAETLGSVLRSVVSVTVVSVAAAMALSELGLDLTPVVASAGIVGVAVGFGAQNLVKDFLTGVFMLLEDQYGVGDVVDAGPATGTVEAVGLRTTRLRDVEGTVWHIRNGEIVRVGNKSQGWARAARRAVGPGQRRPGGQGARAGCRRGDLERPGLAGQGHRAARGLGAGVHRRGRPAAADGPEDGAPRAVDGGP